MEKRTISLGKEVELAGPLPECDTATLKPAEGGAGWEIWCDRRERRKPKGVAIYPEERVVSIQIFLDLAGTEIGRVTIEREWSPVKDGTTWAEQKSLETPDAEKVKAKVGALKFYQSGSKK
jgi:hypothetical protein